MRRAARNFLFLGGAAVSLLAAPAALAQDVASVPRLLAPAALPVSADVASAYDTFRVQPIWFRGGAESPAVAQLVSILNRAPFDGIAEGPQLAAQVLAASAQVRADPSSAAAADRAVTSAWVRYVQALKRPTPGMIYAVAIMKPHGTRTEEIVLTTAAQSSLSNYLTAVSNLNPIYAQLRDTAWAEAQASGNLTPDPRLLANLERARSIPSKGKFALVDSGTQRLILFENAQVVDTMKVIVGKPTTPTPMLAGTIHYATFNPYWNIPTDVARRTVAPLVLKRGVSYLRVARYEVTAGWATTETAVDPASIDWKAVAAGAADVHIRQLPGPDNMMGALKFGFVNDLGIYLHDTPHKELFGKPRRNFSLGCVRVEDARRLGAWLLGREPVPPSTDPEQNVQLEKGVPVYITYLTAQPEDGGKLAFADDVYGRDPKTEAIAEVGLAEVKLTTIPASVAAVTPH